MPLQTTKAEKIKAVALTIADRKRVAETQTHELSTLARSAGITICDETRARCVVPHAKYFIGTGKVETLREMLQSRGATTLIINRDLSPRQENNLARACACEVVGYTRLILEIFSRRARSHEGKLQVELARMQYLATRLVRGWSHLERQRGGIGLRGGPGEKQLETDRRLLRKRIDRAQAQLHKIKRRRQLSLRRRRERDLFSVALIGYTNVGKSTLFRQLTGADAYCADMPFATLDPTIRRLKNGNGKIVLSDTVGFIADLPHTLVNAFEATLAEVCFADLLVHVIDASQGDLPQRRTAVENVLRELKANHIPRITVFNKADCIDARASVSRASDGRVSQIMASASTGDGVEFVAQAICERASSKVSLAEEHAIATEWAPRPV